MTRNTDGDHTHKPEVAEYLRLCRIMHNDNDHEREDLDSMAEELDAIFKTLTADDVAHIEAEVALWQ